MTREECLIDRINRLEDILACAFKQCYKGVHNTRDGMERSGYEMVVNMILEYEEDVYHLKRSSVKSFKES